MRWGAACLSLALAFLSSPIVSIPGAVAISLALALYNLPAAFAGRLPARFLRPLMVATLALDFLVCSAWSVLTANDPHVANYVMFAVVAVEAAVFYRWRGAILFSAATVLAFVALYVERQYVYGFAFSLGSLMTRAGTVVLLAVLLGNITDQSDRRRRAFEAAAQDAETAHGVLRTLVDGAPVGIASLDREGRIVDANPAFHALVGYPNGALIGSPLAALAAEEESEAMGPHLRPGRGVRRWRRATGEVAWIDLSITPAPAAEGGPAGPAMVAVALDVTAQWHEQEAVRHRALHDALTGLPNRLLLEDRLRGAVRAGAREGHRVAVAEIDLDGFKAVNDTHGHWAGDAVLVEVAERLVAAVRDSDTVARFGGDEIVVVMPGVEDSAAAMATVRKLLDSLAAPFEIAGEAYSVAASAGVALYPDDGQDAGELLARADDAMYSAKRAGGALATYSGSIERRELPVTPPHLPLWTARAPAGPKDSEPAPA